jgi:heterodisulfide reductase subunit A
VVHAESSLYTCSQDSIRHISQVIAEQKLNRVVVASCSPLTHQPLFQDSLRAAGLNPYLFEMANIRNQCSWVHSHEWEAATGKAKELVQMAVARAALLEPQYTFFATLSFPDQHLAHPFQGLLASRRHSPRQAEFSAS